MNSELKFFTRQEYKGAYAIQPHTHPCYEIVYYLTGTGTITVNGEQYEFQPHTLILTQKDEIHSERAKEPVTVLFLGFTTEHTFDNGPFYSDPEEKMLQTIMEIESEMKQKDQYYEAVINLLTEKLLYQLQRQDPSKSTRKNDFAYILNYMHANANQKITVEQIAYTLGYNYDYFRQLFIKNTKQSAKTYLMRLKLNNVKEYLINFDYTLDEIAQITGFSSTSHLCMVFKKQFGVTPAEFKKRNQSINKGHNVFTDI